MAPRELRVTAKYKNLVRSPDSNSERDCCNAPVSYSDQNIKISMQELGCKLRSKLVLERDPDGKNKLTHWLTRRRIVYIITILFYPCIYRWVPSRHLSTIVNRRTFDMKQPVSAADVYVNKSTRLLTGLSQISADSASPTDTGPVTAKSTTTLRSKSPLVSSPPPKKKKPEPDKQTKIISSSIYPLTSRVVWAQIISQLVFLHFSPFSTALWDLANSRPVHSLMTSSHLFLCLPCLLPRFTVPCKMVLARPVERETWQYHPAIV